MREIRNLIATPATDAKLQKQYRRKGNEARLAGANREDCPFDGMIAGWWLEGYDQEPQSLTGASTI